VGKLVASIFVSLDNIMVSDNEDMSWVLENFDPEMGSDMGAEVMNSMQAIFIGRKTHEGMIQVWPNVTEDQSPGADAMNHTPKFVFSRTLDNASWGRYDNATVVKEIDPARIQRMKQESPERIVIFGSASIVQQMTDLGLIDEYLLWVHPVILGSGKPLFKNNKRTDLKLVRSKAYGSGVTALTLQPKTEAGSKSRDYAFQEAESASKN